MWQRLATKHKASPEPWQGTEEDRLILTVFSFNSMADFAVHGIRRMHAAAEHACIMPLVSSIGRTCGNRPHVSMMSIRSVPKPCELTSLTLLVKNRLLTESRGATRRTFVGVFTISHWHRGEEML